MVTINSANRHPHQQRGTLKGSGSEEAAVSDTNLETTSFARGTRIATLKGEIPVERLKAGDKIITRDVGAMPLRWAGSRKVAASGASAPVLIRAGALGNIEDLVISQGQSLLLSNPHAELLFGQSHVLVPARYLVNNTTICLLEGGEVEYWHLMFSSHQVVYANGVMAESFFPSKAAIEKLEAPAKSGLLNQFPELPSSSYGPAAAPVLKEWEASLLLSLA